MSRQRSRKNASTAVADAKRHKKMVDKAHNDYYKFVGPIFTDVKPFGDGIGPVHPELGLWWRYDQKRQELYLWEDDPSIDPEIDPSLIPRCTDVHRGRHFAVVRGENDVHYVLDAKMERSGAAPIDIGRELNRSPIGGSSRSTHDALRVGTRVAVNRKSDGTLRVGVIVSPDRRFLSSSQRRGGYVLVRTSRTRLSRVHPSRSLLPLRGAERNMRLGGRVDRHRPRQTQRRGGGDDIEEKEPPTKLGKLTSYVGDMLSPKVFEIKTESSGIKLSKLWELVQKVENVLHREAGIAPRVEDDQKFMDALAALKKDTLSPTASAKSSYIQKLSVNIQLLGDLLSQYDEPTSSL